MRDYYLQRLIFKATLRVFWGCFFFLLLTPEDVSWPTVFVFFKFVCFKDSCT